MRPLCNNLDKGFHPVAIENAERYNVRSVDRALTILSTLADGQPRTLTELSEDIEINTSTTFRLLATLDSFRYVERDADSGKYKLGLACLELARAYSAGNDVRRAALPELEALRDATKETVHLAALDGMDIIYLEKLQGLHAIGLMSSRVGNRNPAYCTGVGKALLAHQDQDGIRVHFNRAPMVRYSETTIVDTDELLTHLETVRRQGYALDQGEHEAAVRCVAAPIFDRNGRCVAAISVSGPRERLDPIEDNQDLIDLTLAAVRNISARLGFEQEYTR